MRDTSQTPSGTLTVLGLVAIGAVPVVAFTAWLLSVTGTTVPLPGGGNVPSAGSRSRGPSSATGTQGPFALSRHQDTIALGLDARLRQTQAWARLDQVLAHRQHVSRRRGNTPIAGSQSGGRGFEPPAVHRSFNNLAARHARRRATRRDDLSPAALPRWWRCRSSSSASSPRRHALPHRHQPRAHRLAETKSAKPYSTSDSPITLW